jgi:hypothetical protein
MFRPWRRDALRAKQYERWRWEGKQERHGDGEHPDEFRSTGRLCHGLAAISAATVAGSSWIRHPAKRSNSVFSTGYRALGRACAERSLKAVGQSKHRLPAATA